MCAYFRISTVFFFIFFTIINALIFTLRCLTNVLYKIKKDEPVQNGFYYIILKSTTIRRLKVNVLIIADVQYYYYFIFLGAFGCFGTEGAGFSKAIFLL